DLPQKDCLSLAAALEAHANHPIARSFATDTNDDFIVSDVQNVIGSGIEGMWNGKIVKIGSAAFVQGKESGESQAVYLSVDGKHVASFYYRDPIRKESKAFIQRFADAGIKTTLLTGDSLSNAQPVANEIGIDHIVASAKPEDKLAYLKSLDENSITMMVGDGINDAPTLAGAHLSVAMGGGTDVAKASADMTLLGDNLEKLLEAR
ncbi:HAD-IC family P-type ATPase, partial [Vibrio parahaemolyticus]|nr:HAD-IC family P-type ATPase [Vibrio parahaemolyticus]